MNVATTNISSWAVDLKDVGAIYPFQGSEFVLFLIGFGLWILWHIVQIKRENRENAERVREHGNAETIRSAINSD